MTGRPYPARHRRRAAISSTAGGKIFAGELFGDGQLLDANRYYLILPDNIGHGKSSKPSDSLHGRFPKYGYEDMIRASICF